MTPHDSHHAQPDLSDYLALLNRRKWVIAQSIVIVAAVAYFLSAQQSKLFEASANVLLTRQNVSNIVTGVTSPDFYVTPERFAATQAGLARSPDVVDRAVRRAELQGVTGGGLLARSTVVPRSDADLLRFTVQDSDPKVAATLANAYATAFTTYKADLDTAQLAKAREELQRRIQQLRKQGDTGTDTYQELLNSSLQLRTMELLQTPNLVVSRATGAAQIAPTPRRNGILGAFVGLMLGLGIAFLWEALDKRVRSVSEMERRLGLPLLARVPEPPKRMVSRNRLTMLDAPQDAHAEAIRRLRTNVEFANIDRQTRSIMVTSAVQREGKSTTVANLAVALVRAGRSVALVELDLRQPTMAAFFSITPTPGVTDVVLGRTPLEDALSRVTLPGATDAPWENGMPKARPPLAVLPSGELPGSPGEFVGTKAVEDLIHRLRNEYDFVLVDAPPMLAVGDAMTLSSRVDAMLLVCRLGLVNRGMLNDLARELDASPAKKLGIVATGVESEDAYGYGYGTGYGYEYGRPTGEPLPSELSSARTRRRPEGQRSAAES